MKKLIISLLISFAVALFFVVQEIKSREKIYEMDFVYDDYGRIKISANINGKDELFSWDTGSSVSMIIKRDSKTYDDSIQISRFTEKTMQAVMPGQKLIFGNDSYERVFLENDMNVFGGDIINSYYWYFDLLGRRCTISPKPIDLDFIDSGFVSLQLDFVSDAQTPICNVNFNNSIESKFLFDSGHSGGVIARIDSITCQDVAMRSDIWCYKSDTSMFRQKLSAIASSSILTIPKEFTGLLINGAKVNNLNMTLFIRYGTNDEAIIVAENHRYFDGYITSDFIRRFSAMYYNPIDNQIILYASKRDIPKLLGKDIYKFIETVAGKEYPYKVKD